MNFIEYFEFLPYGKYAFYIWFSYLITFLVVATLFIRTAIVRKRLYRALRMKYLRKAQK